MTKNMVYRSILAAFGCAALPAFAAVPGDSPYRTELTYSYNQDATTQAINVINTVACYIKNFAPEQAYAAIGDKPYVAQVDRNLCDSDAQVTTGSTGQGGATAQPNYETATVQAAFANNELTGKIWSASTEDGVPYKLFVHYKIRGNAEVAPPYGDWEVYWCSSTTGAAKDCGDSSGFVIVGADGVRSFDRWQSSSALYSGSTASNLQIAQDKKTGGGRFSVLDSGSGPIAGVYAFNADHVYANVGGSASCKIPNSSLAGARVSPWETWLYDAQTGQRVNRNSGFSMRDANGNWAWAGYWGVSIGNTGATNGQQFTRYDSNGNPVGTYTAVVKPGKLRKVEIRNSSLASLTGVTLKTWGSKSLATGNSNDTSSVPLYLKWDGQNFVFSGYETCPQSGNGSCTTTNVSPRQVSLSTLTGTGAGQYNYNDLWLWKDGSGIGYRVVMATWGDQSNNWTRTVYQPSQVVVRERSESNVLPTDTTVPSTLYCVGWSCADSNGQSVSQSQGTSVNAVDSRPWTWVPGVGESAGFMAIGSLPVDFRSQSNFYSGALVTASQKALMRCNNGNEYCEGSADDVLTSYYRWTSSANSWDNYSGVKDSTGTLVAFDPPLNVDYTVPTSDRSDYAGRVVGIQYPGSGQLWLPGYCFNETTGARMACGNNVPWATEFTIPFDETVGRVVDPVTNRNYLVKTLRRGLYYPAASSLQDCGSLQSTAASYGARVLPTVADWKNPADPASSNYIGEWRDPVGQPMFINGQRQY